MTTSHRHAEPTRSIDPKGRGAASPTELPAPAWADIARRVWKEFFDDRVMLVSAGATFYILLALVPALAAFVAVYGLIFDRQNVVEQVSALSGMLAPEVRTIIEEQLNRLTAEAPSSLGIAFAVSLAASLWSASAGTKAIIDGLNIVNEEDERRGFLRYNATALALTLAGLVGAVVVLGVTIAVPVALDMLLPNLNETLVKVASYAVLLAFLWGGLIVLYRYGPSRDEAEWRWLATGTVIAVILLAAFAVAFSWFARSFAGYASYGSIGAVIGFMTWVWVSVILVLLGAEINAEMEHQTARDTTAGPERPIGARGAAMADRVASSAGRGEAAAETKRDNRGWIFGGTGDPSAMPADARPRDMAPAIAGLVLLTAILQIADRYVRRRQRQREEERYQREAEAYRGG